MEEKFDVIPSKTLIGEKIILSKPDVTFEYAIKMFTVVEQNREHILPWLSWAMPEMTKSAENSFMYAYEADKDWEKQERFEYAIYDKATNEYCGAIGVMKRGCSHNKTFELGFWLKKEVNGRGYMNEAVKLIEKEFFNLGVERLIIRNDVKNIKSRKVAEKAGFQFEGCQRHGAWSKYLKEFTDINVFSKLRKD